MCDDGLPFRLQQSCSNNDAHGITGMLLYKNQPFMQALEGEHVYSSRSRYRFFVDFSHACGSPVASPP